MTSFAASAIVPEDPKPAEHAAIAIAIGPGRRLVEGPQRWLEDRATFACLPLSAIG